MAKGHYKGYHSDMERARAIRKYWADNVHRLETEGIGIVALRAEVGEKFGISPRALLELLAGRSHREINQ